MIQSIGRVLRQSSHQPIPQNTELFEDMPELEEVPHYFRNNTEEVDDQEEVPEDFPELEEVSEDIPELEDVPELEIQRQEIYRDSDTVFYTRGIDDSSTRDINIGKVPSSRRLFKFLFDYNKKLEIKDLGMPKDESLIELLYGQLFDISECCNEKKYTVIKQTYSTENLLIDNEISQHIKDNYICQICSDLIYPCVVLYCGHSYCENCAAQIQNKYECSYCRAEIIGFSNNYIVNNFIGLLKIKCPNECEWTGNLNNLNDHLNLCLNRTVKSSCCNTISKYKDFINHCKNECPKRKVECPDCSKVGPFEYLNIHSMICPEKKIYCKSCHTECKKYYLPTHLKHECPKRSINCQFCNRTIIFDQMEDHRKKCNQILGYCPCCEKYNMENIVHQSNVTKHISNCKFYFRLMNKYLWANHDLYYKLNCKKKDYSICINLISDLFSPIFFDSTNYNKCTNSKQLESCFLFY